MRSKKLVLATMAAAVISLSACGGGGDDQSSTAVHATPIPADAIDKAFTQRVTTANDEFCADHGGLFSQRSLENLNAVAHPEIIQTTFDMEVTCNDHDDVIRTFVILTGELVS